MAYMVGINPASLYGSAFMQDLAAFEQSIQALRKHRSRMLQLIDGDTLGNDPGISVQRTRLANAYGVVSAYATESEVDPPASPEQSAKALVDRLGTVLEGANGVGVDVNGVHKDLRSATISM